MEIAFDEIMVGERGRAHGVLASNLPDGIARSLAHHLDLPGQLPPGFELNNCVSGFPHAGRYVIARTSLDPSAERPGMVFSHALVADLNEIGELIDIAAVFALLKRVRPQVLVISKTTIRASEFKDRPGPSPSLCDTLATSSDHPVVIGNPLALEGIVSALWPRLLPAMRRELWFRLSFGPEESDIGKRPCRGRPTSRRDTLASRTRIGSNARAGYTENSSREVSERRIQRKPKSICRRAIDRLQNLRNPRACL